MKYVVALIPVVLFLIWTVFVFFRSLNDGEPWQVWFSGTGLVIVLIMLLLMGRKLVKR